LLGNLIVTRHWFGLQNGRGSNVQNHQSAMDWSMVFSIPFEKVKAWKMGVDIAAKMNLLFKNLRSDYAKDFLRLITGSKQLLLLAYAQDGDSIIAKFYLNGSTKMAQHFKTVCAD